MNHLPPAHEPPEPRERGFSLLELLMYALLASGLTAAVCQALIAGIRIETKIELQQRAIDLWGRIRYLIESEVAEGNEILYGQSVDCKGGGTSLFTIQVPVESASNTTRSVTVIPIHYFEDGGNLMRCGPPFHANGNLATDTPLSNLSSALVGRRVSLTVIKSPEEEEERRSVHYHINITAPDGSEIFEQRTSIARTRGAEITQ